MRGLFKWLRGLGPLGSTAANAIQLVTTNWVLTMSALFAIWAGFTDWIVGFVQNPRVQTVAIAFLALLWTSVGIAYLIDRRRPRTIKPEHDYRYGLTFENVGPVIGGPDFSTDERLLRFAIQLRNFSSGPIKYVFDEFDVRLANRALPIMKKGTLYGFMARGAGRASTSESFKRGDFKEFFGQEMKGTIVAKISYGHPEREPVRQLSVSIEIFVEINENGTIGWGNNILEESDKEIA